MSILDRILLILLSLAGLVVSVFVFLMGIGMFGSAPVAGVVSLGVYPNNVYAIVISIVFALISARFVFYRQGRSELDYVTLHGEHGHIRISHETIRQLANRTGRGIRGVQEFDTRVRMGQAGILLSARVRALPDLDLSRVSAEIQNAVKDYVERTTGVVVERVIVNVAEIAGGSVKTAKTWVE